MSLESKLEDFDRLAERAFVCWMAYQESYRDEVIARGRERLIEGHHRYGDRLMYEFSPERLVSEALEEAADGVNYWHCRLLKLDTEVNALLEDTRPKGRVLPSPSPVALD